VKRFLLGASGAERLCALGAKGWRFCAAPPLHRSGSHLGALGDWLFTCDQGATAEAYGRAQDGGANACTCNTCRNFVVVRDRVFPAAFLALLDSLGIDPHKDGEVYHNGRLAPGRHDYGGWFHFVGSLDRTGDFPVVDFGGGFTVWLTRKAAPVLAALKDHPLVELQFHATNVPWGLDEPESAGDP
jgi:hypothetical protein